jgi:hypothetical protein
MAYLTGVHTGNAPGQTEALAKVARRNGTEAALASFELRSPNAGKQSDAEQQGRGGGGDGLRDLFVVPSLRRRMLATLVLWFAASFSYYGLTLRAEALPG